MSTILKLTCPKCGTRHEKEFELDYIDKTDLRLNDKYCDECWEKNK